VPVLLTQTALVDSFQARGTRGVPGHFQGDDRSTRERVASGVTPENLAYVIYTRGSTVAERRDDHARSMVKYAKSRRFASGSSGRPDPAVLFDQLRHQVGDLPLPDTGRDPGFADSRDAWIGLPVHQECERMAISVLSLPTAFLARDRTRLGGEISALPPALRLVIIGGERGQPERLARWKRERDLAHAPETPTA